MKKKLAVIILTYNEELHLERAINSVKNIANEIFIVDSYSKDKTKILAEKLGAKVFTNEWKNYASQFNWALKNLPIESEWVMRLDADEYLTENLCKELKNEIENKKIEENGLILKRRVYFQGRWIKYGGNYPIKLLRIWKTGKALCEQQWMDEHMVLLEGETKELKNDFIDENLRDITWWTEKHNGYATREMIDTLIKKYNSSEDEIKNLNIGLQGEIKRRMKKIYQKFPLFLRPFIYFNYRYFVKLGFLDGKEGLIWNFLQGFWYRFLVDTKIYEYEKNFNFDRNLIEKQIKKDFL